MIVGVAFLVSAYHIHSSRIRDDDDIQPPTSRRDLGPRTTRALVQLPHVNASKEKSGEGMSMRGSAQQPRACASDTDTLQRSRSSVLTRVYTLGASFAATLGRTLKYLAEKLEGMSDEKSSKVCASGCAQSFCCCACCVIFQE